jgi:hypothetical protein
MRAFAADGLRLRAAAACRSLLALEPDDAEARETLHALLGRPGPVDDVTVDVAPADVLHASAGPPPLPDDALAESALQHLIERSRLARDLSPDVGHALTHAFEPRDLAEGDVLMRRGHTSPGVFVIDTGEIAMAGSSDRGGVRPRVVGHAHAIGEMCSLPDNPATGDVVAWTGCTALFLPTRALLDLARAHPPLHARLALLSVCRRAFDAQLRPDFAVALDEA